MEKYLNLFNKQDGIQGSIGGDEQMHDFIRGEGVYKQAVYALNLLNSAGDASFSKRGY